jgi:hypothetical protein
MEPEELSRHLRKTLGCLQAEHPDMANVADRLLYVLDRIMTDPSPNTNTEPGRTSIAHVGYMPPPPHRVA